jgi:CHASE2 domain
MKDLIKESFLATLLVLVITFAGSYIPIKFEFVKPIKQGFLDFDIYDLYYSGSHLNNTKRDSNITLVEIGNDRKTIAEQINLIQKFGPAVIGIDAVFENKGDSLDDIKLTQTLGHYNNIILASKYELNPDDGQPMLKGNFFDKKNPHFQSGYINLLGSQFSVIRNYPSFLKIGDAVYPAFTSAIVKKKSPEKFNELKKRNNDLETINYTGNLESYTSITKEELQYYAATGQLDSLLSRKIVLLGYFVKGEPLVLDDLHFSPLNERVAGKSFPDMYGIVIHANILSMILNKNYANRVSDLVSYFVAGIIVFSFLLYILSRYKKPKHPKHGWFLLLQLILILVILYIFLLVFNWFQIKVPLLSIMMSIALSVELLGLYREIAVWLHQKYHYKTVFSHKHII